MKTSLTFVFLVLSTSIFCQLSLSLNSTDYSGLKDSSYAIYTLDEEQIQKEVLPQFLAHYNSPNFLKIAESSNTALLSLILSDYSDMNIIPTFSQWKKNSRKYYRSFKKGFKKIELLHKSLDQISLEHCRIIDNSNGGIIFGKYSQTIELEISKNDEKCALKLLILSESPDFNECSLFLAVN